MRENNIKGQSLFEIIISVIIVSVVLIALINLSIISVGNTNYSKNNTLATRYTQEAMEWLRGERDKDWNAFSTRANTSYYCMQALSFSSPTHTGQCANSNDTIPNTLFTRQIRFTRIDAVTIQVSISTSWTDGTGVHFVTSTGLFTNWKSR